MFLDDMDEIMKSAEKIMTSPNNPAHDLRYQAPENL